MSTQALNEPRMLLTITALLPVLLDEEESDHEKNKQVLNELGLLRLCPIPDIVQASHPQSDPSFSIQHYSNIPGIQSLFHDSKQFYHSTRITITEFILIHDALVDIITSVRSNSQSISHDHNHSHPRLTPAEELLLWICHVVGSPTPMLELIFSHLSYTTIHRYADHVTRCINSRFSHMIQWPEAEDRKALHGTFSLSDNVIAVLDGTHCPLQRPTYDEREYYSGYKGYHSQNFLIACNVFAIIIYVDGPYPGREMIGVFIIKVN